ncbi:P-loop ATPase, Sll1717 family [Rhizobium leguminosarum]|uniref:P-loop ATPase, Sll1717 family n=1 Tax=Rhizobium leguminosarum TaxID=384 RepID=UPI0010325A2B|nr:hypothetical protein [Rhizobium leguminosarum]TBF75768.1 hypothetical protein ELG84_24085 [Rhizobium leguminosarum]
MARNNHIITRDIRVGKASAEEDLDLLFDCFVDSPAMAEVLDLQSNASILAGRTGSGKSAIIQYIHRNKKTSLMSPGEMAMTYISNSDVMRFLNDIGADLALFFQVIWKHALLVEFIRLKFRIDTEGTSQSWFRSVWDRFSGDRSKERALAYLEKYSGSLWVTMDENIRQLTATYEEKILAELGVDINKFVSKAGYGANLSQQNKSEYVARVRKVINADQLQDLSKVITLLADGSTNSMESHYILVDNLDDRWVDESIKYKLINALIEAVGKFRQIRTLKIIVALRSDVIERSIQENTDSGFQREKFRDKMVTIEWTEKQLKELINKRISSSFRRKYSPQRQVLFEDVFVQKVKHQAAFDYMVERTLLRPRDLIAFTNECLDRADNRSEVSPSNIYEAEAKYSEIRLEALIDEWRVAYPSLKGGLDLVRGRDWSFHLNDISDAEFDNCALEITGHEKSRNDPVVSAATMLIDHPSAQARTNFKKALTAMLYRAGAVGLKLSKTDPITYSHLHSRVVKPADIPEDAGIRVVWMLAQALRVIDRSKRRGSSS